LGALGANAADTMGGIFSYPDVSGDLYELALTAEG
jgi:hypothetical protein